METYTSSTNSIIGSDYISGLINGIDDYVVIPISNTQTVVLQGDIDGDTTESTLSFEGERWLISRDNSYGATYTTDYTADTSCSISIPEPYYCRGNLDDMSVMTARRADLAGSFAVTSLMWGVLICAVLWSLLRSVLRCR